MNSMRDDDNASDDIPIFQISQLFSIANRNDIPIFPTSSLFSIGNNSLIPDVSESSSTGYARQPQIRSEQKKEVRKNQNERFRPYQSEKWTQHFEQLLEYRKQHGHCLVPHDYPRNPSLAGWVKRQRHQYKLYQKKNRQSFMTTERIKILEDVGFVWDSHEATWYDRLEELLVFKREYGSCLVPSNYLPNLKLATWVKSQRRQYKLHRKGLTSNMSKSRIKILEKYGFEWEVRSESKKLLTAEALSSLEEEELSDTNEINLVDDSKIITHGDDVSDSINESLSDSSIHELSDSRIQHELPHSSGCNDEISSDNDEDLVETLMDFLIAEEADSSSKKLESIIPDDDDLEDDDGCLVDAIFDFLEDDDDDDDSDLETTANI